MPSPRITDLGVVGSKLSGRASQTIALFGFFDAPGRVCRLVALGRSDIIRTLRRERSVPRVNGRVSYPCAPAPQKRTTRPRQPGTPLSKAAATTLPWQLRQRIRIIACITVSSAGKVAMERVLAGVQVAHDTMMVQEAYSATRADKIRFWARRWLVLDDMGQGSISYLPGASGLQAGGTSVARILLAAHGRRRGGVWGSTLWHPVKR